MIGVGVVERAHAAALWSGRYVAIQVLIFISVSGQILRPFLSWATNALSFSASWPKRVGAIS